MLSARVKLTKYIIKVLTLTLHLKHSIQEFW